MRSAEKGAGWKRRLLLLAVIILVGGLITAFIASDTLRDGAFALLDWFEGLGAWGAVLYSALYSFLVLLLLPAVIFTFGAGFIFGFWTGALVIATAIAVGSTAAFLLARYAFGAEFSKKIIHHPRLRRLNSAMRYEGWKIVFLSRLVPGFPFKLSNYFFGLTPLPLRAFFLANLAGVLPMLLINVYLGSVAANLDDLLTRERQPLEWLLLAAGVLAAGGLIVYIRRIARRSMARAATAEAAWSDRDQAA